ncbi:MAG: purine-binding chemotaxis protein CheW [Ardenticatenaceae bacterium]|nr:purine-binding chemotaxis protein CheW [Ardenticatenaceae bacterium]MCB9444358.1 purine-binding chemotaxis protein CheW [Ardenticatenaceae bacterium]
MSKNKNTQVLTFQLGSQEYALDIINIVRVVRMVAVTPAPNTPPVIEGVVNVRGRVIPVLNLRIRFGLTAVPPTIHNHLLIVRTTDRTLGLIVDRVSKVLTLGANELDDAAGMGSAMARYLAAVGKLNDRLLLILDPDSLLSVEEAKTLTGHTVLMEPALA